MAEFKITTTGTLSPIEFPDVGTREFVHPVVDLDLVATEGFELEELLSSEDVKSAIDAGHITVKDNKGQVITSSSNLFLTGVDHALESHTDVDSSGILNNRILVFKSGSGNWEAINFLPSDDDPWQNIILDKDLSSPPGSPTVGDRYIVGPGATGSWTGHEDEIAEWNGSTWDFVSFIEGMTAWVSDEDEHYVYDGASWKTLEETIQLNNVSGSLADDTAHGNRGGGSLHSLATTVTAGFMSGADKTKLDSVESGATDNQDIQVGTGLTGGGSGDIVSIGVDFGTGSGKIVEGDDTRIPTQDENDALVGTFGTPSGTNEYVTDSDPRMTDSRAPTGAAGGDLAGTYPNPDVVGLKITDGGGTNLTIGAVADGEYFIRSGTSVIGTPTAVGPHAIGGAQHTPDTLANLNTKVSDATLDGVGDPRPPTGAAGGDLSGTYPNPDVTNLTFSGPTSVSLGSVNDGETLTRSGGSIVGGPKLYPPSTTDPVTPTPGAGDQYFNTTINETMVYDASRSKFLSITGQTLEAGRNGNTAAGSFYRMTNGLTMDATNLGYPVPKGTLTYLAWTRNDGDSATLEVLLDGSVVATLLSTNAGRTANEAINADFNAGILTFRNLITGNITTDVQIVAAYKRRA